MPLYAEMPGGQEYVTVLPQHEGNWDSDRPIKLRMKALGYNAGIAYQERLAGRQQATRRQRQERVSAVLREKLEKSIEDGSIEEVYGYGGKPATTVRDMLGCHLIPLDFLLELQDIADSVSYLQSVTEEAWLKYRQEKEDAEREDVIEDDDRPEQEKEREELSGDEEKN